MLFPEPAVESYPAEAMPPSRLHPSLPAEWYQYLGVMSVSVSFQWTTITNLQWRVKTSNTMHWQPFLPDFSASPKASPLSPPYLQPSTLAFPPRTTSSACLSDKVDTFSWDLSSIFTWKKCFMTLSSETPSTNIWFSWITSLSSKISLNASALSCAWLIYWCFKFINKLNDDQV